jgi:hypothetical protein
MTNLHLVTSYRTEELSEETRSAIIEFCVATHQKEDFRNLFAYVPLGGWHFLAYSDGVVVSHAMATTRWLQPEGHPLLKTAYVDACRLCRRIRERDLEASSCAVWQPKLSMNI